MSVGEAMGVTREDVISTIMGHTGLPASVIGAIDIRERHLFVDVAESEANAIASKLRRTQIKGANVKVKIA